ncbi:unnamed protein product [Caenorhabditis brenneri]
MLKTLIIFLCFGANIHAESIASSNLTSTAAVQEDVELAEISATSQDYEELGESIASSISTPTTTVQEDVELAKIAATCLSHQDYEELGGNTVRHGVVRTWFGMFLVRESIAAIGLAELRAALDFPPLPRWQKDNRTDPSEEELSAAPTIEAYYDLKEPRSRERSLDSGFLLEHNMIPAIAFLDKRFPVIRRMFKRKFGEILEENQGLVDRKIVDRLIEEFGEITRTARRATSDMLHRGNFDDKCWDDKKLS